MTTRGGAVALTVVLPLVASCLELATFLELDDRLIDPLDGDRLMEELDDDRSSEFRDEVLLIDPFDVDAAEPLCCAADDPLDCAEDPPAQFGAYFVQIS